jgi:small basic protein
LAFNVTLNFNHVLEGVRAFFRQQYVAAVVLSGNVANSADSVGVAWVVDYVVVTKLGGVLPAHVVHV